MTTIKERIFDCDIHVIEPPDVWAKYADAEYKSQMPRGSRIAYEGCVPFVRYENLVLPDVIDRAKLGLSADDCEKLLFANDRVKAVTDKAHQRFGRYFEMGWSGKAVLAGMDEEKVDVTVLFPTSGLLALASDNIAPKVAAAVARSYNNYLNDLCSADRSRLYGAAMISLHDLNLALEETRRAVQELGCRAIFIRPNMVLGRHFYDPVYDPLWSLLEELNVPVILHEGIGSEQPHVGKSFGMNFFLHHVACHPLEMMLAVMSFCGGGILAKHPGLRVGFFEANCGWLPFLLDRLDDHYEHEIGVTSAILPEKPSTYFKRQCYLSCEADERLLPIVSEIAGNSLTFSTDFPHPDSKFPRSIETLETKSGLSRAQVRKILWDNPVTLYGMQSILGGGSR